MNSARSIKRSKNPGENVNPFSAATFLYTIPTFIKGYKKPLEENDLYATLTEHQSEILANQVEILWNNELEKANQEKRKPSLTKVFLSAFGFEYMVFGLILATSEIVLKPAQAVFLGRLLLYYMPNVDNDAYTTQFEARLYAVGIALMSFLYILSLHPLMTHLQLTGLKAKIACCSLIYRKALKLNNGAFNKTNVGQIVNLISTDAPIFIMTAFLLNYIWIGPIQTVVVTYLMYREVGVSSIIGVLLLFAFIPIHHLVGKAASKYRLKAATRTDARVCYMNEIILGIKAIKMFGWEKLIKGLLLPLRNLEMKYVRQSMLVKVANLSFEVLIIPIVVYVTITMYVLHNDNDIRADKVFTLIIFYNSLRATMASSFPPAVGIRAVALVSMKRIEDFLQNTEVELENIESTTDPIAIRIIDGQAKWNENLTLKNINLTVNSGNLVAVIGQVGCGKSSLINVMLNELHLFSGKIQINGQISYASQEAWLFSGSIRDNILFGEKMDISRYKEVVRVCALESDFGLLPFGDHTIVGGRGASLSGGQKARINLARALYRDSDIYLLDEPFAAVDARVGKQIFEGCIKGFLKGRTVILVTHQWKYLKDVDEVIVLEDGRIVSQGPWGENEVLKYPKAEGDFDELEEMKKSDHYTLANGEIGNTQDIIKEQTSIGSVSKNVYKRYLTAGGHFNLALAILLLLLTQAIISGGSYFLTYWVNTAQTEDTHKIQNNVTTHPQTSEDSKNLHIYVYSAITFVSIIIVSLCSYSFFSLLLKSAQKLHNNMFSNVISGTMHFFNTNSQGRIINRFSQDMAAVETQLPYVALSTAQLLLSSIASILLVAIVNYWLLIPTIIIGTILYIVKKFCLLTTRNVKRLEGVTRSPAFEHLSSSLQGLTTIRAFRVETILKEEFDAHQDLHSCSYHLFLSTTQGFGYFLDCLCTIYIAIVTLSFIVFDNAIRNVLSLETLGGDVGLAITQSISLMGYLQFAVLQTAELENNMTSVERIIEYDAIEQEDNSGIDPPKAWPKQGEVLFRNVSLKYSSDGPLILKNVNFKVSPMEKIGIIGRTGAGKSSVVNALLRLSYTTGDILIDKIDIKNLSLLSLRTKISVIPQDPTLFSGTLRQNLDPFEQYGDSDLWNVLEEVELKDLFMSLPQGLCHVINQGGANISVGQRQLICLARAILRNNNILVMDEATANIDLETDNLIQRTIKKKFEYCTVFTIAHRLETVIDSDKVVVMDAGEVVEFDKPSVLLTNTDGYFYKIVQQLRKNGNVGL